MVNTMLKPTGVAPLGLSDGEGGVGVGTALINSKKNFKISVGTALINSKWCHSCKFKKKNLITALVNSSELL